MRSIKAQRPRPDMNIPAAKNLHLSEEGEVILIPLEHNLNDKGSLFAGSIYAGAVLAAYRAAERCFAGRGLSGNLVAKTASIDYLKSIVTDGHATGAAAGEPLLKPNGNHSLTVTVTVNNEEGSPCAEFKAEFILLKNRA